MAQSAPVTTPVPDDNGTSAAARLGTALVLISFILAVVFAYVPASFDRSTITWRPDSGSDSGSLQLTRGSPERMTIETTCDLARAQAGSGHSLLSTGSIDLSVVDDVVVLQSAADGPRAEADLPSGDCVIRAAYAHETSLLQLSVGDVRDEVVVDPPAIQGLYTTDPASITKVDIATQETGLAPSWGRWTVGLVALAALLAGAALLWLPASRPRLVPRLAPVDGFVTVGVVGLALVTPPLIDDGWIFTRSRELLDRWWFGDLYAANDAWLPQGTMHEVVLSVLQAAGLELAHVRILVALLVALTWVVLRRGVLVPVVGEAASRWPAAAATYVAFAGAWMITVRQEPTVVFLAVLALAVAVSAERSVRPGLVFAGLLAAGLALATHQSGWVAAAPAAMILWSIGGEIRRDRAQLPALTTAVVAATSGFFLVVFAAADIHTVVEGASTLSEGAHSLGALDELARYDRLFAGPAGRVSTVLVLLVWCLVGSLGINHAAPRSRRLWILCMLWLGGLLVTSSKWEWHLAVYAVPAVGLATLAGVELHRRDRASVLGTSAVLVMVGLTAGMGMSAMGGWNLGDLSNRTWPELTTLLVGEPTRIYWYLALLALLALGMLADGRRGRWQPAALVVMCLSILFPIGASMAWLVADAREPGWSLTGANLRQLTDSNACGVLDGLDIDADSAALAQQDGDGRHAQLAPEGFPQIERLSTGPLGGEVPTWGTWAATKQSSPDARTGQFQSPSFRVGDAEEITIWSAFGAAELLTAEVVFTSSSGSETTTPVTPDPEAHWARLRLTVPDDAAEVRVDVEDQNSGYGGWLAVSSPVVSSNSLPSSVLSSSTGFANPLLATQVPCMELPDLSSGYWGRVEYVASEGSGFNVNVLRGLTVTDVACPPDDVCLRRIDYPMADVLVTPAP